MVNYLSVNGFIYFFTDEIVDFRFVRKNDDSILFSQQTPYSCTIINCLLHFD